MHLSSLDTRPWQSCVAVALGSKYSSKGKGAYLCRDRQHKDSPSGKVLRLEASGAVSFHSRWETQALQLHSGTGGRCGSGPRSATELRSYPTLHTVHSREFIWNLTAFAAIEGGAEGLGVFSTGTGDEQGGLEGCIVSGARCMVVGARSFVWDPCLYAKHLNCPFIIVSDFFQCAGMLSSYPVLPFNPSRPVFLPHFPQMKVAFLKDFFFF